MPDLDPDHRFFFDIGSVSAGVWATNPGAGRVVTVLINKLAGNNVNLFTAPVLMGNKVFPFGPVDQSGVLPFKFMQWHYP